LLSRLPILDRRTMPPRKVVVIGGIRFSAIPVQHSIRAPAVGYRVSANDCCFFYLPDVAELPKAADALRGIDVYIGDGQGIVGYPTVSWIATPLRGSR
jgi:Beta-lactamase superfamily domain